jgi:hypothetical protein
MKRIQILIFIILIVNGNKIFASTNVLNLSKIEVNSKKGILLNSKTRQCKNKAKSTNKRCKKMTSNASGYCHLHGG